MKKARLIKKGKLPEPAVRPTTTSQVATIKHAMKAVQNWVKDRRTSQQEQARQMFAALFVQPQG